MKVSGCGMQMKDTGVAVCTSLSFNDVYLIIYFNIYSLFQYSLIIFYFQKDFWSLYVTSNL